MGIQITHAPVSLDPSNSSALTKVGQRLNLNDGQIEINLDVDDLKTLSGVAGGSTHLGVFSGSTISDNVAIKAALQELETAVESATTDAKVGIDVGATPDYLGAAFNDGVLRTSGDLSYTDGGDFVTIGLDLSDPSENLIRSFFNGTFVEGFDALVTSDGATVTLSLEQQGTGDLTMQFSDGYTTLDCTPAQTITLTAGTDAAPQNNWVYVLQSTKLLTLSTAGWPAAEHIKVAYIFCPSATYVQADGVYINQNINDHLSGTDNMGHLAHIASRSRLDGAYYFSGIDPTGTDQDTNTSYFDYVSGSESYFKSGVGVIKQMHDHTYPAQDSRTNDILLVNHDTTAYTLVNDLTDITADATGTSLANKYFNIVFVGVGNKGGEYAPLLGLLPTGSYSTLIDATGDVSGYDSLDVPREFRLDSSTAFFICRMTFKYSGGTSTLEVEATVDLRGRTPTSATGGVGGGGGVTDHGSLTGLTGTDHHTQYAYLLGRTGGQVYIGGDAASNPLTLRSTSHATKGNVIIEGPHFTDEDDATKIIDLNISANTTSTTRTWTAGDRNLDFGSGGTFQDLLTFGIADNNAVEIDGSPNSAEYARFTANGIEGRTEAEFKADFNLEIGTDVLAYSANVMFDNVVEAYTKQQYFTATTATRSTGGTYTLDLDNNQVHRLTVAASFTFDFSNFKDGGTYVLYITNGGAYTVTWAAKVRWPGGTAPTLTTSGTDIIAITSDGTNVDMVHSADFQ